MNTPAPIKGLLTVMGLVVLCAQAVAAPAEAERVMAIGCRIGVTADGGAIRIDALVHSRTSVTGHYRFDVQKGGAGGISQNTQSGDFSLEADREKILSTTVLGVSEADHYQAKLLIVSSSGSVSCVSP
jgi:hypothetical protein